MQIIVFAPIAFMDANSKIKRLENAIFKRHQKCERENTVTHVLWRSDLENKCLSSIIMAIKTAIEKLLLMLSNSKIPKLSFIFGKPIPVCLRGAFYCSPCRGCSGFSVWSSNQSRESSLQRDTLAHQFDGSALQQCLFYISHNAPLSNFLKMDTANQVGREKQSVLYIVKMGICKV